jgi:hypothetical protein
MNIIESSILDITKGNINQQKVLLLNQILSLVTPILDGVLSKKVEEKKILLSEVRSNQEKINQEKLNLESMMTLYQKEKEVKKALDLVSSIDSVKIEYNRSLKHELVVLLRTMEKLPVNKFALYLQNILKVSNKTINKTY